MDGIFTTQGSNFVYNLPKSKFIVTTTNSETPDPRVPSLAFGSFPYDKERMHLSICIFFTGSIVAVSCSESVDYFLFWTGFPRG